MTEINFDTGICAKTYRSKAIQISKRLKSVSNSYIGNKRKIIIDLFTILDKYDVKYNSVFDLFCGSGVVSLAFKLFGSQKILANDIMKSSMANTLVFLENDISKFPEDKSKLFVKNEQQGHFVRDHYSERFTPEECDIIDLYQYNAQNLYGLDSFQYAYVMVPFIHYIMSNCFVGGRLFSG